MKQFRKLVFTVTLGVFFAGGPSQLRGQANFYEGKTIRVIVGLAAGGGYDVYAHHRAASGEAYSRQSQHQRGKYDGSR
jgi:tripartite-type tricarboxylate transporter receptor subunit TctC